ncbi:MAG: iron complex outermembrane receptor protein [Phenylobacterium sp.]|jgi:iron complex outermembrane receptor protein
MQFGKPVTLIGKSTAKSLLMTKLELTIAGRVLTGLLLTCSTITFSIMTSTTVAASGHQNTLKRLKQLSLSELTNIEVSIASKTPQRFFDTPAAIFVITEQDINRSGATRLPDLLRMVPGFNVSHIDNNIWAVSARGFGARFANKLLVSIDGRTIYNPLFSGIFWEMQDVVMTDIARIEVIRGPGGSVWGSNAVNGVVNIITKKAQDNQGGRFVIGGGNTEKISVASYGGKTQAPIFYHFSAKVFDRDTAQLSNSTTNGNDANDDALSRRLDFRADWQYSETDELSFFAQRFDGHNNRGMEIPDNNVFMMKQVLSRTDTSGHHMMLDWQHQYSGGGHGDLRLFYDKTNRHDRREANVTSKVYDIEYQHQADFFDNHSLSWGLGYRVNKVVALPTSPLISFVVMEDHYVASAHIQDDIALDDDKSLFLTLGSKFENTESTGSGVDVQPNVRIRQRWDHGLLWGAVSKAVRAPSISDHGLRVNAFAAPAGGPQNLPISGYLHGEENVSGGELIAWELGFRTTLVDDVLLDFTVFHHDYDDLINSRFSRFESVGQGVPEYFRLIIESDNGLSATTNGLEAAIDWQLLDGWKLHFAYSYLDMNITIDPASDQTGVLLAGQSPKNQLSVRSLYDLSDDVTVDLWFRYVDELSRFAVDSYLMADLRLGWQVNSHLEVSLTGRNLTDKSHFEFGSISDNSLLTEVERSIFLNLQWQF